MEQNCFEHQKETFERVIFRRFNSFCWSWGNMSGSVGWSGDSLSGYVDQRELQVNGGSWRHILLQQRWRVRNQRMFPISVKIIMTWANVKSIWRSLRKKEVNSSFRKSCVIDVICQNQQIKIHGAPNKGESLIPVVRNIKLIYMVIKVVRKRKIQMVATGRRVIALWHVRKLSWNKGL